MDKRVRTQHTHSALSADTVPSWTSTWEAGTIVWELGAESCWDQRRAVDRGAALGAGARADALAGRRAWTAEENLEISRSRDLKKVKNH